MTGHLGVDFSGGAAPWKARCTRPSVWIAELSTEERPRLVDLRPVQALPGDGEPFERLIARLRTATASVIDAPFSLPARHMPEGEHAALLAHVRTLRVAEDRPFPRGAALVELAREVAPLTGAKPMRETERLWRSRGLNVRSTLWNGPRGGAPFAAACLTLLARAGLPIWPWSSAGSGLLAEAFPAAQLKHWGLPHQGYVEGKTRSATEAWRARETIIVGLAERCDIGPEHRATMLDSPDALDAVVAAFAARAVARGEVAIPPPEPTEEGWIAVHR